MVVRRWVSYFQLYFGRKGLWWFGYALWDYFCGESSLADRDWVKIEEKISWYDQLGVMVIQNIDLKGIKFVCLCFQISRYWKWIWGRVTRRKSPSDQLFLRQDDVNVQKVGGLGRSNCAFMEEGDRERQRTGERSRVYKFEWNYVAKNKSNSK